MKRGTNKGSIKGILSNYSRSLLVFHFSLITFSLSLFTPYVAAAQELETLINEALSNNPEIRKYELQYEVAAEKKNEVHSIPNTEFGVAYFLSEPETRTGAQRFKVSVKQMLPWFGTITSRENYVSALADAKYEDIVIAKRKLMASVSQSYYKLYANKAKQQVLLENIALLKTYETMALTSVETGKASAVDVLRLQMRQNELQQLKEILEQKYLAEQSHFNGLLNRASNIELSVVANLEIPEEAFELDSGNIEVHPELLKYDKIYHSVTQSEMLNQKERRPMIGFGLDYINVEERPDMDFTDNGKDIVMPMMSVSIPIFNKKYKSKSKQNEWKQLEIQYQKEERLNVLQTRLDKAIYERNSARISYETQEKNLKKAKDAEHILIKSYESASIHFNDVLDVQELQLKFQMNQIESVLNYYVQTAIINYLTH